MDVSTDCDPIVKNKDIYTGLMSAATPSKALPADDVAWPCGLVAKSFFNDTYKLTKNGGNQVDINEKGIAWESDKEYKFANYDLSKQWIDVTNGKLFWL